MIYDIIKGVCRQVPTIRREAFTMKFAMFGAGGTGGGLGGYLALAGHDVT